MSSVVEELQNSALQSNISVADLLRRALVVAYKLKIEEFQKWINNELNGYVNADIEIPDYRWNFGELQALNPALGWIPVAIEDAKFLEQMSNWPFKESIAQVEKLQSNAKENNKLKIQLNGPTLSFLQRAGNRDWAMRVVFSNSILSKVIDSVRTVILRWALDLIDQGILLDKGFSLSSNDENKVKNNSSISHVNNYFIYPNVSNLVGNISGGSISQVSMNQATDIQEIKKILRSNGIDEKDVEDFEDAIKNDPQPNSFDELGSNVGNWFAKMIGKAASGAWKVAIGAGTQLLTEAISKHYGWM